MPTLHEGKTPGDWLLYEGDHLYSRDVETITGGDYESGTVLGKVTADEKFIPWDPAASDGSQVIAGILFTTTKAATADVKSVVIKRHAEIRRAGLSWGAGVTTQAQRDQAMSQLLDIGIKNV